MEEKLRILKMVEEGTITAEQAGELLKALGENEYTEPAEWTPALAEENVPYEDRMLRIVVDSVDGDKVRIQLPVKVIKVLLETTGKLPIQVVDGPDGVDLGQITDVVLQCLSSESIGSIVDVESADGDTVKIFIG